MNPEKEAVLTGQHFINGAVACAEGAIAAGCRFFAGYPITPATEIAERMSVRLPQVRGVYIQMEDELASMNAILGASWAGVKSMTATSGPGFSLMQEALGWGHVVEAPCAFVNSMRVGPSTGMPTQPAQSDLLQIKAGSAGDYYPIAFYPHSVEECFRLAVMTFNAAEESLSPVILLADAFLSHLYELVTLEEIRTEVVSRTKEPLGKGQRLFTGTVHDKMGNVKTSDPVIYREWLGELKDRHSRVAEKYPLFEYLHCKDSNILLIAFGITSRIISAFKERFSIFRPIRIYPVLEKELREVTQSYPRIIVIEGSDGQYASWVEWAIGRKVMKVACLGGGFKLKWIQSQIEDRLKEEGK